MRTIIFLSIFTFYTMETLAQNAFVGKYDGTYNGDKVTMTLRSNAQNTLTGDIKDSEQTFVVEASTNGNKLMGTAIEATLGLNFILEGTLTGNQLPLNMTLEANGKSFAMAVDFIKQGSVSAQNSNQAPPQYQKVKLPSGATNDPNLVGNWVKNESYNSGYGSDAMSGSFSQSMLLFADGSMGDGGSRVGVSGSNYSGSSQGGAQALPNVVWYNIENQLYVQGIENGQTQTVHLGRYYIEDGKLLITGTNGKKLFLQKQ